MVKTDRKTQRDNQKERIFLLIIKKRPKNGTHPTFKEIFHSKDLLVKENPEPPTKDIIPYS